MHTKYHQNTSKGYNETGLKIRVPNRKIISYFSTKTYIVGTQKTVLLSTQYIC